MTRGPDKPEQPCTTPSGMIFNPALKANEVNPLQLTKMYPDNMAGVIVTVPVKFGHPEKALSPIVVTESGMTIGPVKAHVAKACLPIVVTESGMTRGPVKPEQYLKA